jgi:phage terminase small subunit
MNNKLTAKQEKFCQCVAEGDTYSGAYRKAYNVGKKTSQNTVYVKSSELMDNGKVTVRVDELKKDAIKRNEITIDQVLLQLKNWLLFDPLELIDEDTEAVKNLKDMSKEARMSLAEITVSEIWGSVENPDGKSVKTKIGELKKLKFIDKRATAEMFMKKFGQYLDNNVDTSNQLDAIREIIEAIKK